MQPNSDNRLLAQLTPSLGAHANEADRLAQWAKRIVRTLIELPLFRLWIPRRYGGFELPLSQTLAIRGGGPDLRSEFACRRQDQGRLGGGPLPMAPGLDQ